MNTRGNRGFLFLLVEGCLVKLLVDSFYITSSYRLLTLLTMSMKHETTGRLRFIIELPGIDCDKRRNPYF